LIKKSSKIKNTNVFIKDRNY